MIKCILVDDEIHVHNRFKRVIKELDTVRLIETFESVKGVVEYVQAEKPDIVFLDINMPIKNGIELAYEIISACEHANIVFLTAYDEYAVEAFELNAVDYILKPLTAERLEKTLKRIDTGRKNSEVGNIEVGCFGAFTLKLDGKNIPWKNRKVKELFAFLIHKNGAFVSWQQIADALYPEKNADKAHTSVNVNLFRLRECLNELGIKSVLIKKGYTYAIDKEKIISDYFDFLDNGNIPKPYQKYFHDECYEWAFEDAEEIEKICKEK